jgi:hypothetical protein
MASELAGFVWAIRRAQSSRLDISEQPVMRRARPSPLAAVIV